jgi:hypothetical protein
MAPRADGTLAMVNAPLSIRQLIAEAEARLDS